MELPRTVADGTASGRGATSGKRGSSERVDGSLVGDTERLVAGTVAEIAADLLLVLDADLAITRVDHVPAGLTAQQLIGSSLLGLFAAEAREETRSRLAGVLASRYATRFETALCTPAGLMRNYEFCAAAQGTAGAGAGLMLAGRDISDRQRDREELQRCIELTESIRSAQSLFIADADNEAVFNRLLDILVSMTGSEFGFLDEVCRDDDGSAYKLSLAMSNIAWDAGAARLYADLKAHRLQFRNLGNLAGAPVTTGQVVISNSPSHDHRSRGLPPGHPPIRTYMGIPMFHGGELIGVAGVANRPDGYHHGIARFLEPLTATCAGIIAAVRSRRNEERLRARLHASEEQFRLMAENSHDLISLVNATVRPLWANNAWMCAFGSVLDASADRFERLHPEDREIFRAAWDQLVATGQPIQRIEYRIRALDESYLTLESALRRAEHTDEPRFWVVARDVTQRQRAEQALAASEAKYRELVEQMQDVIYAMDREGKITFINSAIETLLGYTKQEVVGRDYRDFVPGELRHQVMRQMLETYRVGSVTAESILLDRHGEPHEIEHCSSVIIDGDQFVGVRGIIRDITPMKRATASLKQSEAVLNEAQEIAEIGSFVWDLRDDALTWSQNMFALLGISKEQDAVTLSSIMADYIHPDDRSPVQSQIRQMVACGETWPMEFRVQRPDGEERIWRSRSRFLKDQRGHPIKCVGVHYDVTEQKRVQSERLIAIELFQHFNARTGLNDLMRDVTCIVHDWSQCDALGIRLREQEDYPYLETRGFPPEFLASENRLCALDASGSLLRDAEGQAVLECWCGRVIRGNGDPAEPYFTPYGSFWTNSVSELLAECPPAVGRGQMRNRCCQCGYESLVLIPLRCGDTTLGLMQFSDSRKARFTCDQVRMFERLAANLALALTQRQAAEALAESEGKFRAMFEQAPDSVVLIDAESCRVTDFNQRAHETLGYTREEFARLHIADIEATETPAQVSAHMRRAETLGRDTFETMHRARDGRLINVLVNTTVITAGDRRKSFLSVWTDITQLRQAEKRIREEQRFARAILDSTDDHIAVLDRLGTIVDSNRAWDRFAADNGSSPAGENWLGANYLEVCQLAQPPGNEEAEACLNGLRGVLEGRSSGFTLEYPCHSASQQRWFRMRAVPLQLESGGAVVLHTNITEQKLLEARQLAAERVRAEAERLAATGRMAAQVAHEINNPLAGIKNAFRLVKHAVPDAHPDHDMVGRIEREIDRIAHIVRQMYSLHTPRPHLPVEVNVAETIRDVLAMLESLCREHEVTIDFPAPVPGLSIRAREGSLQQVLYNLLVNAIHASPSRGVILLRVASVDGPYVRISVRDHGRGIPPDVQRRMFEPFYSSGIGEGLPDGIGLGLSIVRSIVESLHGRIEFESALGQGTCFHVYLPANQPD